MGVHRNGLVSKVMSGSAGLIAAFALLTACAAGTSSPSPPFDVLSAVERGTTAGLEWRVELVHKGGELCTAARVRDDLVGLACQSPSTAESPLNFAVDGHTKLILVHGLVSPRVSSLEEVDVGNRAPRILPIHALPADPAHRYFAYAVVPGQAVDLIARDADGAVLMSGAAKLADVQTVDDGPPPKRDGP